MLLLHTKVGIIKRGHWDHFSICVKKECSKYLDIRINFTPVIKVILEFIVKQYKQLILLLSVIKTGPKGLLDPKMRDDTNFYQI